MFLEPSQAPDEALEHTELQHAVDAAIAALPEKARLAVQLRRFENMPYEEIARALDMTVPATKGSCFLFILTMASSKQVKNTPPAFPPKGGEPVPGTVSRL